jgi:hypothetical protein
MEQAGKPVQDGANDALGKAGPGGKTGIARHGENVVQLTLGGSRIWSVHLSLQRARKRLETLVGIRKSRRGSAQVGEDLRLCWTRGGLQDLDCLLDRWGIAFLRKLHQREGAMNSARVIVDGVLRVHGFDRKSNRRHHQAGGEPTQG